MLTHLSLLVGVGVGLNKWDKQVKNMKIELYNKHAAEVRMFYVPDGATLYLWKDRMDIGNLTGNPHEMKTFLYQDWAIYIDGENITNILARRERAQTAVKK
jgi:hypothetical protein